MKFIKKFADLSINDVPLVGGKNASLGEMIQQLSKKGILIPQGFAITVEGYWHYLKSNNFLPEMKQLVNQIDDVQDLKKLQTVGKQIRALLENGTIPDDLKNEVELAYNQLSQDYKQTACDVAVRSSATAEDLPEASFAGQQDTFLNVSGLPELLASIKKSIASLFTDRAIVYRKQHGFDDFQVALSVGIQKMVRSDKASAGVVFSLDTETGFKDAIVINSSWGLGEAVVKGEVNPDEFRVFKPTLRQGFKPIIKQYCGEKKSKIIYGDQVNETITVPVLASEQHQFSLSQEEILQLSDYALLIEDHYSSLKNSWVPMDIEWAKDGIDGALYIVQARPETVHSRAQQQEALLTVYTLEASSTKDLKTRLLVTGQSIGQQIVTGVVRIVNSISDIEQFNQGDILVTGMTDPDWVPLMKKAGAIVTDQGGRTCHAAIVSRELQIPAIVGTRNATTKLHDKQDVTVDCSKGLVGYVYNGSLPFSSQTIELEKIPQPPVPLWLNIADSDRAFSLSFLPCSGVGLARTEFIIANTIQIHPMAAVHPEKVTDTQTLTQIKQLAAPYNSLSDYFVDALAQGAGSIAAAFYPRPVIVRLSDFKSNEYRNLLGGKFFEPEEANPMLGLRGASRYYSPLYKEAFSLECKAMLKVRQEMGLTNLKIMVPFVRTTEEAKKVIDILAENGLVRGKEALEIIMMVEVPSNALLINDFCTYFDGFSIGSNDLTQTTLALDRDSELLISLFDERNAAVKDLMHMAIQGAKKNHKHIGICGQAPSDFPEMATFLISEGIDYLSLNADAIVPFLKRIR